ncbi:hypothetical protein [Pseudomonas sp. PS01301]|uniref:hypothetical protein n=1 Tax=Pseudomonas sp. PS01301 TaxID=2991437 RepID=UPI002499DE60|nr:hypothetical protein [Pseudomonas sp. PS01301]
MTKKTRTLASPFEQLIQDFFENGISSRSAADTKVKKGLIVLTIPEGAESIKHEASGHFSPEDGGLLVAGGRVVGNGNDWTGVLMYFPDDTAPGTYVISRPGTPGSGIFGYVAYKRGDRSLQLATMMSGNITFTAQEFDIQHLRLTFDSVQLGGDGLSDVKGSMTFG